MKNEKKFKSVRPKIDVTNQCHRCGKFYNDKDVAILEEGPVCLNCMDTNNPEDVNKMVNYCPLKGAACSSDYNERVY